MISKNTPLELRGNLTPQKFQTDARDLRWHALHVRWRFERVVALNLRKRHIQSYIPLQQLSRGSRNRMQSIASPLFPGYVFCKCNASERPYLWTIPGVLGLVGEASGIDVASEQEISDLRRIVKSGLPLRSWPFTSRGMMVSVKNGRLNGVTGIVKQISGKRLLIFSIPLLRCSVALEVEDDTHLISFPAAGSLESDANKTSVH